MVFISFPGLGIDEFSLNRVAFSVGRLEVRWYGIIIVLGIITAFLYAHMRSKEFGVSFDDLLDVALYTVIAGIVGARIYYVLSKLDSYTNFWDVFKIWEGGIAIYGAIIGGGLALFIVSRIKKLDIPSMFDAVAPGVMIAQAIGRWGNFFNGEAYGVTPSESSPLYFLRMTVRHENWGSEYLAQPCFLYESLWNLLGFVLINIFYKKKRFNGQIFLEYLIWYGFGRFFIESQRTDSLYIGATDVRKSMLVGAICVIVGLGLLIAGLVKTRKAVLAEGEYADLFPNLNGRGSQKNDGKASAQSEAGEEDQVSVEGSADESDPSKITNDEIQPPKEENETPDVAENSDSIADKEAESAADEFISADETATEDTSYSEGNDPPSQDKE